MLIAFYEDPFGRRPVEEYAEALQRTGRGEAFAAYSRAVDALEQVGHQLRMPQSRLIDRRRRVFELRFGSHRIAYAFIGEAAVLLHAWPKRSQRLDQRELAVALRRLAEVETE
jgi:phage-related protein